ARVLEGGDATDAAELVKGLPRRRHLQRAQRGEESHSSCLARLVLESIADVQHGRARITRREGGGPEGDPVLPPHRRRDGKESVLQLLGGSYAGPADELLAHIEEGLDRKGAGTDLQHAVLVEKGRPGSSLGAGHRRPV